MQNLLKLILTLLLFSSLTNASEQSPTQEEVAKLYVATFNRAPDSAGLDYWVHSGLTLSGIAASFFEQPETNNKYPQGTQNRDFIQSVYENLFNREPETAGWDYWEDQLNATNNYGNNPNINKIPKNKFILAVINGAQDTADGMDKTILNNKNEVGIAFVNATSSVDVENNTAYSASIKVMSTIDEDTARTANAIKYLSDAEFSDHPIDWINSNWDTFIDTSLAQASTQNAFKAYDAMSVATYLPSAFAHLYDKITDNGVGGHWTCKGGGGITVSFVTLPDRVLGYNSNILSHPGSYEFDNCQLNIDGKDILLDGKILSYSLEFHPEDYDEEHLNSNIVFNSIHGYIKSGFKMEIDNDISITYKAFPFKGTSKAMSYFNEEDNEGSFFEVSSYSNGIEGIKNRVSFEEITLGDIIYEGSFVNTLNYIGERIYTEEDGDKIEEGIYPMEFSGEADNLFFSDRVEAWDRYGEMLIYINENEYFREGDSIPLKASLMGKNNKHVTVWQDSAQTVFAETEDTADTSFTVHTPLF